MNPFHLKDFQSIFSAINPALVGADRRLHRRIPGELRRPHERRHRHSSRARRRRLPIARLPSACTTLPRSRPVDSIDGRGDWAVSARRGNLDRVLDWSGMQLGEPMYSDVYAHVGASIGDSMSLSANLLRFDDDIELADSDVEEQATRTLSRSLSVAAARCASA